jgi:hypothetical protein
VPVARHFYSLLYRLEIWHYIGHLPVLVLLQTKFINFYISVFTHFTARCQGTLLSCCSSKKRLSCKCSHFIGCSLAQLHNFPNTPK